MRNTLFYNNRSGLSSTLKNTPRYFRYVDEVDVNAT